MNETERINEEPQIHVGVMTRPEITVCFTGTYIGPDGLPADGEQTLRRSADGVEYRGTLYPEALFTPEAGPESSFELCGVTIGIGFHWQRAENQRFAGALRVIPSSDDPSGIIAVNEIGLEEYLKSVISSEMSADASDALLKAHAVVSRSWLMRQLLDRGKHSSAEQGGWRTARLANGEEVEELCKWYDREDHSQFDVCADDHCQRYQGVTRQTNPRVAAAIEATRGEMLTFGGEICDARFSKCCGGVSERFENCWEDAPKAYLEHVADTSAEGGEPLCDTRDPAIIAQVLNDYDRESLDFFRWQARYSADELGRLVAKRSGMDFGTIEALEPLERTPAGRITRLLIRGSRRTAVVGKELEIRRWLSESHLRSSAFTVSREANGSYVLDGCGWGHGVGMCQIGAAVMGARGYGYREILKHYFPKAGIEKIY